jgi:predicted nucleic acid-binding protein
MKWFKRKALALYLVAQKQEMFGLVYVTRETERSAYYYFKTARSKNISFADCMLLASADEHKAYTIVSFDAHIKRNSKIIPVIN